MIVISREDSRRWAEERKAKQHARWQQPHWLYRMYDVQGALLYIGQTTNPQQRIRAHRANSDAPWAADVVRVRWDCVGNRWDALRLEKEAIQEERPRHNRAHNPEWTRLKHEADDRRTVVIRAVLVQSKPFTYQWIADCTGESYHFAYSVISDLARRGILRRLETWPVTHEVASS